MKKAKLLDMINMLAKDGNIKVDAGKLLIFDKEQAAWLSKTKTEALRVLFQKLAVLSPETLTSYEINEVRKELMMRPEFALDFRRIALHDDRLHVGHQMLRIDGEKIDISEAFRNDFSMETLDFQFIEDAKLTGAPTWMKFLQHSFGLDVDLTKMGAALEMEAEKIMKNTSVCRLFEFLGYAIAPPSIWGAKKMMVLLGPPNTGKSQLLELVRRVKGEGVVSMTPHDLADRFRSGMLQDATLILNDEIPARSIKNIDILKKVVAGEPVTCEKKGMDPITFCPKIKILFAGNQLPKTAEPDYGDAFARRLSVVVFSKTVEAAERNIHLVDDLYDERNVIFSLAVRALVHLKNANYVFTADPAGDDAVETYRQANASVEMFLDPEMCEVRIGPGYSETTADLHKAYEEFCRSNALDACSKDEFRTRLEQADFKSAKVRSKTYANPRWGFRGIKLYRNDEGESDAK